MKKYRIKEYSNDEGERVFEIQERHFLSWKTPPYPIYYTYKSLEYAKNALRDYLEDLEKIKNKEPIKTKYHYVEQEE